MSSVISASQQVFQIPELFDLILVQLTPKDLLTRVQRVNRAWHESINNSPLIQISLFFRPVDHDAKSLFRNSDDARSIINPLLAQFFSPWYNIRMNPEKFHHLPTREGLRSWPAPRKFFSQSFDEWIASSPPNATWRTMLVQQSPPVRTVGMLWLTGNCCGTLWITAKLFSCDHNRNEASDHGGVAKNEHQSGGLRMGDFHDLAVLHRWDERNVPLICWPDSSEARETFLRRLKHELRPEHPLYEEVVQVISAVVYDSDVIMVAKPCLLTIPLGDTNEKRGWENRPIRRNGMDAFLAEKNENGSMGETVMCGLKERWMWRAKIRGIWHREGRMGGSSCQHCSD